MEQVQAHLVFKDIGYSDFYISARYDISDSDVKVGNTDF